MQEQLDIMKLALADLDSGDSFGSLSIDCDIDEQLMGPVETDQLLPSPAHEHRKSKSLEVSGETYKHKKKLKPLSDRQVVADVQQGVVEGPLQLQKASKRARITKPLEPASETDEQREQYRKVSASIKPHHKDWSERFGSLSDDVDKFLDTYVVDSKRYNWIVSFFFHFKF